MMLRTIRDYLRLLLFFVGVLAGIQLPGFVDQYGKSLQAHLSEIQTQLAGFQRDADRFFSGDLDKLIAHYVTNKDPVFTSGGDKLNAMVERRSELQQALADFRESLYSPYLQLAFAPQADIRREVWDNYSHNILLKGDAIAIGLLSGLLLAASAELLLSLCWLALRALFRRRPAAV
ncbi:DUF2937 family protein [Shewanella algae]|uniref:DUF2937 family protein n=2 Tax=Shewanella algae TaxID=38313 RepID=UPI001FB8F208|nr:DUF2937 family protein [Shewanella algae]